MNEHKPFGHPIHRDENATYYNGFEMNNDLIGAMSYIRFLLNGMIYVGKIHSVFIDHNHNDTLTAEVQLFPYAPKAQQLWLDKPKPITQCWVSTQTLEIPISTIIEECRLVFTPTDVNDVDTYVSKMCQTDEHTFDDDEQDEEEDAESADDEDEETSRWIGFYTYEAPTSHTDTDLKPALPPRLVDDFMSWTSNTCTPWYSHQFVEYLSKTYFQPILSQIVPCANVMYVFDALNHQSMKITSIDRDMCNVVFRRASHVISYRQLNILKNLQDNVIDEMRRWYEEVRSVSTDKEHFDWLRELHRRCENIFEGDMGYTKASTSLSPSRKRKAESTS